MACRLPLTIPPHRGILAQSIKSLNLQIQNVAGASSLPNTHILLPHKEVITEQNAGAIANVAAQNVRLSSSEQSFVVFGQPLGVPAMPGITYQPLAPRHSWISGQNIGLARAYVHYLKTAIPPDLVEVHGRAQVARYIAQKRAKLPVVLYLHNDPREMRGARSPADRAWLMTHLAGIICVSDYIKQCFLDGLPPEAGDKSKICAVLNGTSQLSTTPLPKQNRIFMIGRMVPEKGILPACRALASVLPDYPDWSVDVVGGRHFKSEPPTAYEKQIEHVLAPVQNQVHLHGFQPSSVAKELQNRAAISIVPSLWAEPCGLTGLEALAAGSALITTDRGGIPEYATGRAEILSLSGDELNNTQAEQSFVHGLSERLRALIEDTSYREQIQHKAWTDFPFTAENMVVKTMKAREAFLSRFTNTAL